MKCPRCKSTQTSKNGHHYDKQNHICKQCGRQFVEFYNSRGYSDDAKNICLRMRAKGMGFRAIERATGISHNTVINWVRQANTVLPDTSEPEVNSEDISELINSNQSQPYGNLDRKIKLILQNVIHLLLSNFRDLKISLYTSIMT